MVWPLVAISSGGGSTWGKSHSLLRFHWAHSLKAMLFGGFSSVSIQMKSMNSDFTRSRASWIYCWLNLMMNSDISVPVKVWSFFSFSQSSFHMSVASLTSLWPLTNLWAWADVVIRVCYNWISSSHQVEGFYFSTWLGTIQISCKKKPHFYFLPLQYSG